MSRRGVQVVLLGLAAVALATPPAAAQTRPVDIGDLHLTIPDIALIGRFQFRDENDTNTLSDVDSHERDLFFEEYLNLGIEGNYFHPNLIEFGAVLRLGLTQQRYDLDDESFNSDGSLIGYDVFALILKEKPISGRVFANMAQQYIARSFARPIDLDTHTEGGEVRYRGDFPASVLFQHSVRNETSSIRRQDEESYLVHAEVADERDPDWYTALEYEYEDADTQVTFFSPGGGPPTRQDLPDQRNEINLVNRYRFGDPELPHRLDGRFRAMRREGSFNNDVLFAQQRLELAHSPTLISFYSGTFSINNTDFDDDQLIRGEVGLSKQFYESLRLTGRVYASDEQFSNGYEQQFGGFLEAEYRKQTPIGLYSSDLTLGLEFQSEAFEGGFRNIADENLVLTGVSFQQLSQPNVQTGTVVVMDATNTITYVEGVDYVLQTDGAFTQIRRLVGGGIVSGQVVSVDYTADASTDADFHTNTLFWSNRLQLSDLPLAVYGHIEMTNDHLDGGIDPGNLERRQRYLVGVDVDLTPVRLIGEYEIRDQQLSASWQAYRFRGDYHQPFGNATTLDIGAHYEMLRYEDAMAFGLDEDFRESYGASARVISKVHPNILLRLDTTFDQVRGRDASTLARIGPSAVFSFGQTEIDISGYHEIYDDGDSEGMNDYLSIQIKRRF